jgi:hypothetical protein
MYSYVTIGTATEFDVVVTLMLVKVISANPSH